MKEKKIPLGDALKKQFSDYSADEEGLNFAETALEDYAKQANFTEEYIR